MQKLVILCALLFAGTVEAQTTVEVVARLDRQAKQINTLAKRLVAAEKAIKTGTGVTLTDVDERIKQRAVELPHVRPNGIWNNREAEEVKFRTELRTELDDYNNSIDVLERAVAHPKGGERKAAIRAIRANEGW